MIKTRITELFGIQHPIILAGMNWITTPQLVATVCNAGGLGILATARATPDEARKSIQEIRKLTDKPFGINQTLLGPQAAEKIEVFIQEKVPIVNYSLGKPWFIDQVHKYGGIVVGTIAIARHAAAAEKLGCDALIVTGHEAAAHGADATSLVLIPIVASQARVPLIAAGGFYDGRGLAAALVLGADAISMGTRFMLTKESAIHDNFKQLCLKATEQDTLYGDAFDGMPGRVLKSKAAEAMMQETFNVFQSIGHALELKKMMNLSFGQFIKLSRGMSKSEEGRSILRQARMATGAIRSLKAINEGDVEEGFLFAGQNVGGIRDLPTCKELIERTVQEAEKLFEQGNKLRFRV